MTVVTFSVDVRPRSFIYHILCTTCVYNVSSHLVNYHSKRMCQIYDVLLTDLLHFIVPSILISQDHYVKMRYIVQCLHVQCEVSTNQW